MFKTLTKVVRNLIEYLPRISSKFRERYLKPQPEILTVSKDRGKKRGLGLKYDLRKFARELILALSIFSLLLIGIRYLAAAFLAFRLYGGTYDELAVLGRGEGIVAERGISLALFVGVLVAWISGILLYRLDRANLSYTLMLSGICAAATMANFAYNPARSVIDQLVASVVYLNAMNDWNNENYADSIEPFRILAERNPIPRLRDDSLGRLGGALYYEQDFVSAVEESCKFLALFPDSDLYERQVTTLHWAIYMMGESLGKELAEERLNEISARYGFVCQAEASPFWLGISPEKRAASYSPFERDEADLPFPILAERKDYPWLEEFAKKYPDQREAEYALFIVEDFGELIDRYPDSVLLDRAHYRRAEEAEKSGRTDLAEQYYQELADEFPDSQYVSNAYSQLASINLERGDYFDSLQYYFLRDEHLEEQYGISFLFDQDILYLIDIVLETEGLREYLLFDLKLTDYGLEIIYYSLAERLFAEQDWVGAAVKFEQILEDFPNSAVAELAAENVTLIERIQELLGRPYPVSHLEFAEFLITEKDPIFYNDMWSGYRAQVALEREAPSGYFEKNNDYVVAVNALTDFLPDTGTASQVGRGLFLRGTAYERLGNWTAFMPHQGVERPTEGSRWYRSQAAANYSELIRRFPELPESEEALERLANLFLSIPCDFESARAVLRSIAEDYPDHRLANNALNWIAWTLSIEANLYPIDSPEYVGKYTEALTFYEEILRDYPEGHVADLARQNRALISEKLADPGKRLQVPSIPPCAVFIRR